MVDADSDEVGGSGRRWRCVRLRSGGRVWGGHHLLAAPAGAGSAGSGGGGQQRVVVAALGPCKVLPPPSWAHDGRQSLGHAYRTKQHPPLPSPSPRPARTPVFDPAGAHLLRDAPSCGSGVGARAGRGGADGGGTARCGGGQVGTELPLTGGVCRRSAHVSSGPGPIALCRFPLPSVQAGWRAQRQFSAVSGADPAPLAANVCRATALTTSRGERRVCVPAPPHACTCMPLSSAPLCPTRACMFVCRVQNAVEVWEELDRMLHALPQFFLREGTRVSSLPPLSVLSAHTQLCVCPACSLAV